MKNITNFSFFLFLCQIDVVTFSISGLLQIPNRLSDVARWMSLKLALEHIQVVSLAETRRCACPPLPAPLHVSESWVFIGHYNPVHVRHRAVPPTALWRVKSWFWLGFWIQTEMTDGSFILWSLSDWKASNWDLAVRIKAVWMCTFQISLFPFCLAHTLVLGGY